jgi:CRP-like cAMP-binding protein
MPEVLCSQCPLRRLPLFMPNNADEIALVQSLKRRELNVGPGEILIQEGQSAGLRQLRA